MQRLNRAIESDRVAKFFQSQVGVDAELLPDDLQVRCEDFGLAAEAMMLREDNGKMTPLLDQLLDNGYGHAKPTGDVVSGALPVVVGAALTSRKRIARVGHRPVGHQNVDT